MSEIPRRVLIADDDKQIRALLAEWMGEEDFEVALAQDGVEAVAQAAKFRPDIVLLDIVMPRMDGLEAMKQIRELDRDLPVIMVTGLSGAQDAVQAMRQGASDFLTKPFQKADIFRAMHGAMKERALRQRILFLSDRLGAGSLADRMGPSESIAKLVEEVSRVASSDFTVLIAGETGTGKELVARAIHAHSPRRAHDFVPVDCGAIPEPLFESELFGHEKGAFTNADRRKPGKFELAEGGTLFLDEVTNMPLGCQAKLLRAIQERVVCRVGGTDPFPVDVRLLAAANQDVEEAIESGGLRRDLFYRLNEFPLRIPPLRERKQDILFLAKRFLDLTNEELHKEVRGFSESAFEMLIGYEWPGNVRELRSLIRRAVLLAEEQIEVEHLGQLRDPRGEAVAESPPGLPEAGEGVPLRDLVSRAVETVERAALTHALEKAGGNKAQAARQLKIDYKTIHSKLDKYGMK